MRGRRRRVLAPPRSRRALARASARRGRWTFEGKVVVVVDVVVRIRVRVGREGRRRGRRRRRRRRGDPPAAGVVRVVERVAEPDATPRDASRARSASERARRREDGPRVARLFATKTRAAFRGRQRGGGGGGGGRRRRRARALARGGRRARAARREPRPARPREGRARVHDDDRHLRRGVCAVARSREGYLMKGRVYGHGEGGCCVGAWAGSKEKFHRPP